MILWPRRVDGGDDCDHRPQTMMTLKSGPPEGGTVDVLTIERELDELWARMTEVSEDEDQQAVTRACVLNLVAYASHEKSLGEISQVMAQVSNEHPGRVIIMVLKEASEPAIDAMVTAQCHPAERGRKQICCEQIIIKANRDQISHLPSFVRSLLIADLPVFLWWRDVPDFEGSLFAELVETSDRVIIDSGALPDALDGLRALDNMAGERADWTAFSDLSWCGLTPWRVLVAGFFDLPEYRSLLARLEQVRIECAGGSSSRRSICSQALLLAAWLASRLKWVPVSQPQWINSDTCQWTLDAENGKAVIQIKISSASSQTCAGLNRLDLLVGGKTSVRFTAGVGQDINHLESYVAVDGEKRSSRLIRVDEHDEAQLLGKELEILGHDEVYEQTLKFLGRL